MGIRRALRLVGGTQTIGPADAVSVRRARPTAPWSQNALEQIVAADLFGTSAAPVTRTEAVQVPAISKARWLIATPLAGHPLIAMDGAERIETPSWLVSTDGPTAPQMRMLWTLDDLLFTGYSLWEVDRDQAGTITAARRVPLELWDFDEQWQVQVDGATPPADSVILFTSPMDPLLESAARTIRAAHNIEESWAARVRDPIPVTVIRQTEDVELEEEELDAEGNVIRKAEDQEIVDAYVEARRKPTGSVVYIPYGHEVSTYGETEPQLFVEGRNAVAIDVARFTALPAEMLSASATQASLRYSTSESSRNEFVDYSLAPWAMAIESRLSMDDIVPPGQSVKFDLTHLMTVPNPGVGPTTED